MNNDNTKIVNETYECTILGTYTNTNTYNWFSVVGECFRLASTKTNNNNKKHI